MASDAHNIQSTGAFDGASDWHQLAYYPMLPVCLLVIAWDTPV